MAIARSTGAFIGTDETPTGVALAVNGVSGPTEVDLLGDATSSGIVWLYASFTATIAGAVRVYCRLNPRRLTGKNYLWPQTPMTIDANPLAPGNLLVPLGWFVATRFMSVDVRNEGAQFSQALANFALLFELEKSS